MLVLFTGSRGSGKTTIARELRGLLGDAGVKYSSQFSFLNEHPSVFKKLWYGFALWSHFNWRLFRVYTLSVLHSRGSVSPYRVYFPLIFSYNLKRLSSGNVDLLVYDTDAISWNVAGIENGTFSAEEMVRLFEDVVVPRAGTVLIVRVDTPPEVALERSEERDGTTGKEHEVLLKERKERRDIMNTLLETLQSVSGVHILQIDGVEEPTVNARIIFNFISQYAKA